MPSSGVGGVAVGGSTVRCRRYQQELAEGSGGVSRAGYATCGSNPQSGGQKQQEQQQQSSGIPDTLAPDAIVLDHRPAAVQNEPSEAVFARQLAAEPLEVSEARALRAPTRPAAEEQELHELTHLFHAPWCKHCVQARGRDEARRQTADRVDAVQPLVSLDYFCLSGKDRPERPAMEMGIAAVDQSTGALWASMVIAKGMVMGPYPAQSMAVWLKEVGHVRVTLRSDGEPAILALANAVKNPCTLR